MPRLQESPKLHAEKQKESGEKTKLRIHCEQYKQSLCNFNNELFNSQQKYLFETINKNVNNSHALFSMVDKLKYNQ